MTSLLYVHRCVSGSRAPPCVCLSHAQPLPQVVIHRGTAQAGHYFAYIRDCTGEGAWYPHAMPVKKEAGAEEDKGGNYTFDRSGGDSEGLNAVQAAAMKGSPLQAVVQILLQQPEHSKRGMHYCNLGIIGQVGASSAGGGLWRCDVREL